MVKLLLIFIVITGLAVGYFVFFRDLEKVVPNVDPTSSLPETPIGDTLGILSKKKTDLIDQSEQTKQNITDSLFTAAQEELNNLFGKSATPVNIQTIPNSNPLPDNTTTIEINFAQPGNSPIKIKKGVKYALVVSNTPTKYCIYIQGSKYSIGDDKTLILHINESGNYPIKANTCETNEKDIGQLSVE